MQFDRFALDDAQGTVLAHSVKAGDVVLRKGRRLAAEDLERLRAAGRRERGGGPVRARRRARGRGRGAAGGAGRPVPAVETAAALHRPGQPARRRRAGCCWSIAHRVDRLNAIDEAVTLATLPAHTRWSSRGRWWPRSRSSRSRIPAELLERCRDVLADGPLVRVAPFRPWRARLIQTELPSVAAKVLDKTVRITRDRVAAVGGELVGETRCAHEPAALAVADAARRDAGRLRHAADRRRLGDHRPRRRAARRHRRGRRADRAFRHAGRPGQPAAAGPSATAGRCWACPAAAARPSSTASTGCCSGWRPASRSPGATSCAWASAAC